LLIKISVLLFLIFSGCVTLDRITPEIYLSHLNIINEIQTNYIPAKSVYSNIENTTYIMEQKSNRIHIYKGNRKINTIGGLGFNEYSFNKLSDIALSPDGNLLALDSFEKVIKKFDKDGKWIAEFNFDFMIKPQIFDISLDETFFIYDRNQKEIIAKRITDTEEYVSFGKFMLSEPISIVVNDNLIQVYDKQLNKTIIFNFWGDLIEEFEGNVLFHRKQKYQLNVRSITKYPENKKFAVNISPLNSFLIKNNNLITNSNNKVQISEFIYEI